MRYIGVVKKTFRYSNDFSTTTYAATFYFETLAWKAVLTDYNTLTDTAQPPGRRLV